MGQLGMLPSGYADAKLCWCILSLSEALDFEFTTDLANISGLSALTYAHCGIQSYNSEVIYSGDSFLIIMIVSPSVFHALSEHFK